MKKQDKLAEAAFNLSLEIFGLIDLFPEREQELLGAEMLREAVKMAASIKTATSLGDGEARQEYLPKAYSATFMIEVLLEISKSLGYLENIEKQLAVLEQIREGIDLRLGY